MAEETRKLALVTGASRGLGYATALKLGAYGYHVIAVARTVGGLEDLADAIETAGGPTPTLVPLDLTHEMGLQKLGKAIYQRWGHLDLWVHAAAQAGPLCPVAHMDLKDLTNSVSINVTATQRLITMMEPLLKMTKNGKMIYVADDCAGKRHFANYGATKEAGLQFIKAWQTESTAPEITIFQPNPMPTALRARFHPTEDISNLASIHDEAERLLTLNNLV